jgi:N-methylhydantoinase B
MSTDTKQAPVSGSGPSDKLDPVTFEVLKNAFVTIVDEMGEQILRTCHSFVIWAHDFSCALCDREGNTIVQGTEDCAAHVGTLHFTAKSVIDAFEGEIEPGDVFAVNDPYLGGTHFNDVSLVRPIFFEGELLAFALSKGHWADIGGSVPGSFDIRARDHFSEGVRIPPVRIYRDGEYRDDVVRLVASNTRAPSDIEGDAQAQAEATRVASLEIERLAARYGKDVLLTAFAEVQDYVERLMRQRLSDLPDGTWETVDYLDFDPDAGEGLVPIRIKLEIKGDQIHYDLSGSHPALATITNSAYGATHSAITAGTKTMFPDLPLNSGFYRVVTTELGPEGSVVNATWPSAVAGFCMGPYEKIMNGIFELWSRILPERAMACSYNLEDLLIGGRDLRSEDAPFFMWYDWMVGGWGGRNGRDGHNASAPNFAVGLAVQPLEGQERLTPVLTTGHELIADSGGPGEFRGGVGVLKGAQLTEVGQAVVSYASDRARSISWGLNGGLPSTPNGVWANRGSEEELYLGAFFSNRPVKAGETFIRPSAGGGGYGDPLLRDPERVREDVIDDYVTIERAEKDYGVVIRTVDRDLAEYEVDLDATRTKRREIAEQRVSWLETDAEEVAERYRKGELDSLDAIRRHGVILDWGTGELLPETTSTFRESMRARSADHWSGAEELA